MFLYLSLLTFLLLFFLYSPRCFPPWCSDTFLPFPLPFRLCCQWHCLGIHRRLFLPLSSSSILFYLSCLPSYRCIPPHLVYAYITANTYNDIYLHKLAYFFILSCLTQLLVFINWHALLVFGFRHIHTILEESRRRPVISATVAATAHRFFSLLSANHNQGRSHGRLYT